MNSCTHKAQSNFYVHWINNRTSYSNLYPEISILTINIFQEISLMFLCYSAKHTWRKCRWHFSQMSDTFVPRTKPLNTTCSSHYNSTSRLVVTKISRRLYLISLIFKSQNNFSFFVSYIYFNTLCGDMVFQSYKLYWHWLVYKPPEAMFYYSEW